MSTVFWSEKLRLLGERLALLPDAQERLAYVVSRGRRAERLGANEKSPEALVPGCEARLWVVREAREGDGRVWFRSESEAPMVQGLGVVLCEFYSGVTPEALAEAPDALAVLEGLGVLGQISQSRRRGVAQLWRRMVELGR